ncbi:MAG: putative photosynthetic complex assembly protein PuhE [Parvularculaceae bacterium]
MAEFALPVIVATLLWWLSTGVVMWLVARPRGAHASIGLAATFALGAATILLIALRDEASVSAAYAGFGAGLLLWAWHEIMFLLGFVSGPRKTDCPSGLPPWRRFVVSAETGLHHELAIAGHGLIIAALSWGAANTVAAWTFFLLWGMRLSAKLVIFFGAPHVTEAFLPRHLDYLRTYFSRQRNVAFWPFALAATTSVAAGLVALAAGAPAGSFEATGLWLLSTLAGLAVIEHLALALPLPDGALWRWAAPQLQSTPQRDANAPTRWREP